MDKRTSEYVAKIDELVSRLGPLKQSWYSGTMGGGFKDTVGVEEIYTEAISLVDAVYGKADPHYQRAINFYNAGHLKALEKLEGLLLGTKTNLIDGLLDDLRSKILVEIKSDFLESSRSLLEDGQKDPASVLACVVLEDSIKRLARRTNLTAALDKDLGVASALLLSAGHIEKSTNQTIQSFKNLRNAALHAQWHEVSAESVGLLITFLPMFMEKHGL